MLPYWTGMHWLLFVLLYTDICNIAKDNHSMSLNNIIFKGKIYIVVFVYLRSPSY